RGRRRSASRRARWPWSRLPSPRPARITFRSVARLAELGHRFRRTRAGRILTHPLAAVVLLPVLLFPQVFLRGYVLSPADQLYDLAPWSEYRPPGFQHASNPL